jgi:hypothetical protein
MLESGKGLMSMPCKEIERSVPYFEEQDKWGRAYFNETMNEFVFRRMISLNDHPIDMTEKRITVDGLEEVPDGMLRIKRANKKNFVYTL